MNDAIAPDPKIVKNLWDNTQNLIRDRKIKDTEVFNLCVSYTPYEGRIESILSQPVIKDTSTTSLKTTITDNLLEDLDDLHGDDHPQDVLELIHVEIYFTRDTEKSKFDAMVKEFIDDTITDYDKSHLEDRIIRAIQLTHAQNTMTYWIKDILTHDEKISKKRIKQILKPFKGSIPEF